MTMADKLAPVLDHFLASRLEAVHTCIPGKIVSYKGHGSREAKVKPLVKLFTVGGSKIELPEIVSVPVMFPSTQAGGLVFPVKPGDGVLILFSEAGIGGFLQAQAGVDVDSDDPTRFSLHDAIAIPGLYPFGAVPESTAGEGDTVLEMGKQTITMAQDGSITIDNGAGKFTVTPAGLLSLTNSTSGMKAQIDALWQELQALTTALAAQFTSLSGVCTSPAALIPVSGATPLTTALVASATATTAQTATQATKAALVGTLLED